MKTSEAFWQAFDGLINKCEIVIDRPLGSVHPRYSNLIYPVSYGYLKGTKSMDGGGIDVWVGTRADRVLDAVICIVDLVKQDSEIKLLLGCTEAEKDAIDTLHNASDFMKGIRINRNREALQSRQR